MINSLNLFKVGWKQHPLPDPTNPESFIGWKVVLKANPGRDSVWFQIPTTVIVVRSSRIDSEQYRLYYKYLDGERRGESVVYGRYTGEFPNITVTPIEYVGIEETTSNLKLGWKQTPTADNPESFLGWRVKFTNSRFEFPVIGVVDKVKLTDKGFSIYANWDVNDLDKPKLPHVWRGGTYGPAGYNEIGGWGGMSGNSEFEVLEFVGLPKRKKRASKTLSWKQTPDLSDPKSWEGWKIRFHFTGSGTGLIDECVLNEVKFNGRDVSLYSDEWKSFNYQGLVTTVRAGSIITNDKSLIEFVSYVGIEPKASDAYFDSTPSESLTPEEVMGMNPIPDEKLRRTNPKRYDARTDWYNSLNEHGHDSPLQNKYDDAPALTAGLSLSWKMPRKVDKDTPAGTRVRYIYPRASYYYHDVVVVPGQLGFLMVNRVDLGNVFGIYVDWDGVSNIKHPLGCLCPIDGMEIVNTFVESDLKLAWKQKSIPNLEDPESWLGWKVRLSVHLSDDSEVEEGIVEKYYYDNFTLPKSIEKRRFFAIEGDWRSRAAYAVGYPGRNIVPLEFVGLPKKSSKNLSWKQIRKKVRLLQDKAWGVGETVRVPAGTIGYVVWEGNLGDSSGIVYGIDWEGFPTLDEMIPNVDGCSRSPEPGWKVYEKNGNVEVINEGTVGSLKLGWKQDTRRRVKLLVSDTWGGNYVPAGTIGYVVSEDVNFCSVEWEDFPTADEVYPGKGYEGWTVRKDQVEDPYIPVKTTSLDKTAEEIQSRIEEIDWEVDNLVESSKLSKLSFLNPNRLIDMLLERFDLYSFGKLSTISAEKNVFEELERAYTEPFEKRLQEQGEDVHVLWGDGEKAQERRFLDMTKIGDLNGKSVLDVGSGYGDLIGYLEKSNIKLSHYYGIDFSDKMVEIAKKKHPDYKFEKRNLRLNPFSENSYDYVFGSGIFFLPHDNWKEYVKQVVESMYRTAKIGVAVNFLMDEGKGGSSDLNFVTADEVKGLLKGITKKIDVYEDTQIGDFTVYLFKDYKISALELPDGEAYPDYSSNMDISPDESAKHSPTVRKENEDIVKYRYDTGNEEKFFEKGMHQDFDRKELSRPVTPYGSLNLSWKQAPEWYPGNEFIDRVKAGDTIKFMVTDNDSLHFIVVSKIEDAVFSGDPWYQRTEYGGTFYHNAGTWLLGRVVKFQFSELPTSDVLSSLKFAVKTFAQPGEGYSYKNKIKDTTYYYNDKSQLHRSDGPAIEMDSGTNYWYLNGFGLTEEQFNKQIQTTQPSLPLENQPTLPPEKVKKVKTPKAPKAPKAPKVPKVPSHDNALVPHKIIPVPPNILDGSLVADNLTTYRQLYYDLQKKDPQKFGELQDNQLDTLVENSEVMLQSLVKRYLDYGSNAFNMYGTHTIISYISDDLRNSGYFYAVIDSFFNLIDIEEYIDKMLGDEFGYGYQNYLGYSVRDTHFSDRDPHSRGKSYQWTPPPVDKEKATSLIGPWLMRYFDNEVFTVSRLKFLIDEYFPNVYTYRSELDAIIQGLPAFNPEEFKIEGSNITVGKPGVTVEGQAQIPQTVSVNTDELKEVSLSSIQDFERYGEKVDTRDGMYIYIDNGANILGVAHLDTVQDLKHFDVAEHEKGKVIHNAQLDDRLGAYLILKLLPELGVKADILLTEGEEVGRSTAKYFMSKKPYNWIFQFDRKGIDTVMYQYEDADTKKLLEKYKFMIGRGSVSDISYLESLGIKAFNFGTGYYDNHGEHAHAVESDIKHNVKLFLKFYNDMKDTKLPHTPKSSEKSRGSSGMYDDWVNKNF
jgi:ubiquinone/menaquinone biosynthesis C-methylase UbiE